MAGEDDWPEGLEGRLARVTVAISAGQPGEVVVEVRGVQERFQAYSTTKLGRHEPVVIVAVRAADALDVAPFDSPPPAPG